MTPSRFAALIGAFGASPARWPLAERAVAVKAAGAQADLVRVEAALDSALDSYQAPLDLDRFVTRALASAPSAVVARPAPRLAAPAWALAACALLGVLLGLGFGAIAPTDGADRSVAAAFGAVSDTATEESEG